VAIYCLKEVLRELYSSYPGIEIRLSHGPSRSVCEGVISGSLDFAFVINPVKHPDLVIHKLASDEVGFWKAADGLKNVLIYNPELSQSQNLLNKIKNKIHFDRSIASENLEVIATLASSGTGVAILPSRVVKAMAPELKKVKHSPVYFDEVTFIHRVDLPTCPGSKYIVDTMKTLAI
jgi:DNA-binding transcriptional LysR family regulator